MAFTRPRAAQIDFDVTNISDPLIRLNSAETGSADKDVGIVIERGDDTNVAMLYDESADQFVLVNTTEDGSTSGNVTISSYAGLQANAIVYGSLNDGTTTLTATVAELNYVDGVTSAIQTQLDAKLALAGGTMTGAIAMGTAKITGMGDPTANQDAATKAYVDSQVSSVPTGDITSVVAGAGLTGGATSGDATLNVVGGTGITANANDIAIDATVATLTGTQTLTNKTITAPVLTGSSSAAGSILFKEDTDNGTNAVTLIGPAATADVTITLPASAGTVALTSDIASAGISSGNVATFGSGAADDDFLRINGTEIEGRSASEVLSDIGGQAALTFGISNTNAVKIDSASVADDEYARFTANGLESRSTAEVLSDIGGQAALTFGISNTNAVKVDSTSVADDEYARFTANGLESRSTAEVASDIGAATLTGTQTLTNKTLTSPQVNTNIDLLAQADLRFYDSDDSNYVGFQAPATASGNILWTLPGSDGTEGQVLSTNGGGTLAWEDPGSGGGSGSSYPNSTFTTVPGTDGDFDLSYNVAQTSHETPFEAGGTDAFGVNLGSVFSLMDPIGTTESIDYGDSEAYVGA